MSGGSDRLPLNRFHLQDYRVTVGAVSDSPSTGRASCSCGTCPVTRQASPTANIDCTHGISMPHPSTIRTHIGSILCLIACATGRTLLGCVGRIYLLYLDAQSLCLVSDEEGQLVEAPGVFHAVVFAGGCPTTCTCRALADACKGLDFDRADALRMRMVDDLSRELVVDILHPSAFFILPFLDSTGFLDLL